MKTLEDYEAIRRAYFFEGLSILSINGVWDTIERQPARRL
jgi:hypothetical protein